MRVPSQSWRIAVSVALIVAGVTSGVSVAATSTAGHPAPSNAATPDIPCDKGSMPEKEQGRAPLADYNDGRAAKGYYCNARAVSHFGDSGGYRVERYVDNHGHVCAYYDSTLLFPTDLSNQGTEGPGTYVLDMTNPKHPVLTDTLKTPAMMSPHESLRLNQKRGLLVADMGYPTFQPGFVDVYDVHQDCRQPVLQSSSPVGVFGHESGFAPDGKTFYVANPTGSLVALDLTDPSQPKILWSNFDDLKPHGVSVSNDGKTLFMADLGSSHGLTILDVSQIQERKANPQVKQIAHLTWPNVSIPQNATPFVEGKHHYLLEADEFGGGSSPVGAARIINIDSLRHPYVESNLRLEVNNHPAETTDPGDSHVLQGYQAHYCSLPSRIDPNIVACSFIMSGLRVFDIRNPAHPREVAYFNKPVLPQTTAYKQGSFAMSAPAYDPTLNDIWYTDGESGFWNVHLTAATGIKSFAKYYYLPGN